MSDFEWDFKKATKLGFETGKPTDELMGLALEEYEKAARSLENNSGGYDPRRMYVLGFCRAAELIIRGRQPEASETHQLTIRGMLPPSFFATPNEPTD
jgi:hypothetical protein